MTGPRYDLMEKVRINLKAATVRGITYGKKPILYELHAGGEIMPDVPEADIRPLVANDSEESK